METKIEFYRQRTFSEKMNATFDFIRQNWKVLLKYTFYLIMPICLIQTYAMNSFFASVFKLSATNDIGIIGGVEGFIANYGILVLCYLVGSALLSSLVYALMKTYATRENSLHDVVFADFKDILIRDFWKIIRLLLFIILVYVVIVAIAAVLVATVSPWSLVLTIPIILAVLFGAVIISMILPIYLFEKITLWQALLKAWRLGITTFWGMLGLMIVLYIISSVIQTVTMMPWYILTIIGGVFSTMSGASDASMVNAVWYKFILYILGLVQAYGMYAASIIGVAGIAFQYFHAREKVEGVTIESNIENFKEL
ncbi:MAG: hypothetical protein LBT35_02940 [Tannerella sp.]|jgi:hypothetical protein|nr:hypothetical protein [Tannerella sp.]